MGSLISVIVPVYNTNRRYLLECFESIRLQDHRDIEVIIIDDGSEKDVANFLDNYIIDLKNWRVIHKNNSGLNMARKTGYDTSQGEYITFVDSDDKLRDDFLSKLYGACREHKTDLAIGEMSEFTDGREPAIWKNPFNSLKKVEWSNLELVNNQLILNGYNSKQRIYEGAVWGKLYSRSLLERIDWCFCNYRITEDEFFTIQVNIYAKGVAFVHEQSYFYRIARSESLGQKVSPNAHNGKALPYIQIAREVYEKFTRLLTDNEISYEQDDLVRLYTHVLLDRTRKIVQVGKIDEQNQTEYKKQAELMWPLINENKKIESEWKLLARLAFTDPDLFFYADRNITIRNQNIHELEKMLAQKTSEGYEAEVVSIKSSIKQLQHALARKVKNILK